MARVRPECNVKAHVIDAKNDKPLRSARVELKPSDGGKAQFASTGADGVATIGTSKGSFDVKVTAPSRKAFNGKIELDGPEIEFEVCLNPSSGSFEQKPLRLIVPGEAGPQADAPRSRRAEVAAGVSDAPAEEQKPAEQPPAGEQHPAEEQRPAEEDRPRGGRDARLGRAHGLGATPPAGPAALGSGAGRDGRRRGAAGRGRRRSAPAGRRREPDESFWRKFRRQIHAFVAPWRGFASIKL